MTDEIRQMRLDALKVLRIPLVPFGESAPRTAKVWARESSGELIRVYSPSFLPHPWEPESYFDQAQRVAEAVGVDPDGPLPSWCLWRESQTKYGANVNDLRQPTLADHPAEALLRAALAAWEEKP